MIMSAEERFVILSGRQISYTLTRKEVKNINLRIKNNGAVLLSANKDVACDKIDEFLYRKSDYIIKNLERFEEIKLYTQSKKQYVSGESFYLLGKNIRLKVMQNNQESVHSDGVYLYLNVKNTDDYKRKERLVNRFWNECRQKYFSEIVSEIHPIFEKYNIEYPNVKAREMTTRWGSCIATKKLITLNSRLIEVPRNCIEYVVLHEYCHFLHQNHSKEFYSFLSMLMPDWKERKRILESFMFGTC